MKKIKAILDRVEGKYAIFISDKQEIFWPIKKLYKKAKQGDIVSFNLEFNKDLTVNVYKKVKQKIYKNV